MAVADLAHALEVALGRDEAAAGVLDGLEDHGRDRAGVLEEDPVLDRVGGPQRIAAGRRAVGVGVRDVAAAGRERLERRPHGRQAGGRERARGRAVVGELARDDLRAPRLSAQLVEAAHELERGLDRLRAARGEEDAVEVAGGERGDARGELERGRVDHVPGRAVAEAPHLRGRGVGELGPPVARVDAEERGERVEVAVALAVPQLAALAADDHRQALGAHRPEVRHQVRGGVHPGNRSRRRNRGGTGRNRAPAPAESRPADGAGRCAPGRRAARRPVETRRAAPGSRAGRPSAGRVRR